MATGATKPAPAAKTARPAAYDQVIEQQLSRTRFQLKLVDLGTAVLSWAVAMTVAVLLLTLVDHWLWPLSFTARLFAFGLLLAGTVFYLGRELLPVLIYRINPVFAARAIEQGSPSLKNSLVNYLLLRETPAALHRSVYRALEQRAASDLSHVSVESVVDRTKLLRIGYLLIAVLTLFVAYMLFSPKDPFQTVARVAAPWADIDRPSRVQILNVAPGDTEVFQGQTLNVWAEVRGVGEEDEVTLVYSTADRQVVDRRLPMVHNEALHRYEVQLPSAADDSLSVVGLQQDVRYRVEAGDAVSPDYQVQTIPAPTIAVERVEYEYPAYTQRPARVVEQQGDISALEGTRVTVHARANLPIQTAYLEFDPKVEGTSNETLVMQVDGTRAWKTFTLQLDAERKRARNTSYQVRFTTEDNYRSEHPILHQIEVVRDLEPLVEILRPEESPRDVGDHEPLVIEVRAVDPDFGLSHVGLQAVVKGEGRRVLDHTMLDSSQGQGGQAVVTYDFRPDQLGLVAGDRVEYWAVAKDNRHAPDGSAAPNVQQTARRELRIVRKQLPPFESEDKRDQQKAADGTDARQRDAQQGGAESPGGSGVSAAGEGSADESTEEEGGQGGAAGEPKEGEPSETQQGERGGQEQGSTDSGQDASQGDQPGGAEPKGAETTAGQSQPGGNGTGAQSDKSAGRDGENRSESSDEPLHPGEVFEKIQQHMKEKQAADGGGQGSAGDKADDGDKADGAGQQGQDQAGRQPRGQQGEAGNQLTSGDMTQQESSPDAAQQGDAETPRDGQQPKGDAEQANGVKGEAADGQSQTREGGDPANEKAEPQRADGQQQQDAGEQSTNANSPTGESGAGRQEDPSQGVPDAMNRNDDASKQDSQKPSGADRGQEEPATPSRSQQQSDSEGELGGDRSGGGKQGGGQGANQSGNDSAGSNSSADNGAGRSQEAGDGETSGRGGDQQQAEGRTGKAGDEKGDGQQSRPGAEGQQPGQRSGQTPPSSSGDEGSQQSEPSGQSQSRRSGGNGGLPDGGGLPGDAENTPSPESFGEVPPGEAANLEYANQATDMALEYLKDQENNPDPELLDKLDWTPEELQRFLKQWEQLKKRAREGKEGQGELTDALRSLGLRPGGDRSRSGGGRDDQFQGLRESGGVGGPPAKYLEQFDAFKKGTSRTPEQR